MRGESTDKTDMLLVKFSFFIYIHGIQYIYKMFLLKIMGIQLNTLEFNGARPWRQQAQEEIEQRTVCAHSARCTTLVLA